MVSVLDRLGSLEELAKYKFLVADLDGTLVDGRVAQGMGKYFLFDELKRLHLPHVLLGLANYRKVKEAARRGEAEGLEYFGNVIGRTGCAKPRLFDGYAHRYIESHSLPGAKDVMLFFGQEMETFISTMGSDIAAQAAREFYGCTDFVANPVQYRDGRAGTSIRGVTLRIRDGTDKLEATEEMLRRHELTISDGIVLGNDRYDHESLMASRLAMASPLADEATRALVMKLNGAIVLDYDALLEELDSGEREISF